MVARALHRPAYPSAPRLHGCGVTPAVPVGRSWAGDTGPRRASVGFSLWVQPALMRCPLRCQQRERSTRAGPAGGQRHGRPCWREHRSGHRARGRAAVPRPGRAARSRTTASRSMTSRHTGTCGSVRYAASRSLPGRPLTPHATRPPSSYPPRAFPVCAPSPAPSVVPAADMQRPNRRTSRRPSTPPRTPASAPRCDDRDLGCQRHRSRGPGGDPLAHRNPSSQMHEDLAEARGQGSRRRVGTHPLRGVR